MRAIVLALLALAACAPVKPHQRELLAHPAMAPRPWPAVARAVEQVSDIREGSRASMGTGAGGCGCN